MHNKKNIRFTFVKIMLVLAIPTSSNLGTKTFTISTDGILTKN